MVPRYAPLVGRSFVEFRGSGFWARDTALEVWLWLLCREIELLPETPDWLFALRDHWHLHATAGFNGCVSPSLDRFLTDEGHVSQVLALSERAEVRLREQGALDATALNAMSIGGGATFGRTVPARVFLEVAWAFAGLLKVPAARYVVGDRQTR
jgi:hypothetical protein